MDGSPIWSLGPLTFDPEQPDRRGVHWILTSEEGFWATPATNAEINPQLATHGAFRSPGWKSERTITLEGQAFAPDAAALRRASAALTGLLSDPTIPMALTCYSEIGALTCEVYLDDQILTKPTETAAFGFEWSLQVVAPDPRRYSLAWHRSDIGLPSQGRGGLKFGDGLNFQHGLRFGLGASSGAMVLINEGTAPSAPLYSLHGPLHRPRLTVNTGGSTAVLAYDAALNEGQTLVIDPAVPTALLDGRTPVRGRIFPAQFDRFVIPAASFDGEPGRLCVRLGHDGPTGAEGHLEAAWRHAWF
ncbi:hypothetical protein E1161_13320 [Saccharopolyspora aridisoli]|uniref:Phage tail protein n=1 Tax=Saccharopolyspora aridisoli TaxID=2530385 RepID=A0A4R4UK45_9PSEU|nr:hypothetical protein [Saccharopolyspora aridisoli]TDC92348.1 hypothetical protein E1161_13320 [Saccharopolyspora aridisoli]